MMSRSPIDSYLKKFEGDQFNSLSVLRDQLRELLPEAEECLSYKMPCFKVDGRAVAGFDGFKNHNSYFPHSGNIVGSVGNLPQWCGVSRGTLRFPVNKRLPKTLVKKLVRARLREISERGR